jgi:glutathione S-transferase
MLTLIGSLTSPYVRKVRIALAEKKVEYDFKLEDVWAKETHISEINPLMKVPCLIFEDGFVVIDSRVIVEHVDAISPIAKLIPPNGREKTEVKTLEALADGILDACVSNRLEQTWVHRADSERCQAWIDRNFLRVHQSLTFLEKKLGDKTYFFGTAISLADISVGCALGYLDSRFSEFNWRLNCPQLTSFYARLSERTSFIETLPPA